MSIDFIIFFSRKEGDESPLASIVARMKAIKVKFLLHCQIQKAEWS